MMRSRLFWLLGNVFKRSASVAGHDATILGEGEGVPLANFTVSQSLFEASFSFAIE